MLFLAIFWSFYRTATLWVDIAITKMVNSKFYASAKDIWQLIDQITDDIFTADLYQIASQLMDKADVQRFGTIKWRTYNKQRDKEG